MNRAERRARARQMAKGRDDRRTLARAMKSRIQVADADALDRADPYPNLRAAGMVVVSPPTPEIRWK